MIYIHGNNEREIDQKSDDLFWLDFKEVNDIFKLVTIFEIKEE